jgi:hypothetical protein
MDNKTIDPFSSIEIINHHLRIYNKLNHTTGNMFENMNSIDPTSTNYKTESFYRYMMEHKNLIRQDSELGDVYGADIDMDNKNNYNIYALITDIDKQILYKSFSYINLIYVGHNNINTNINWSIIQL